MVIEAVLESYDPSAPHRLEAVVAALGEDGLQVTLNARRRMELVYSRAVVNRYDQITMNWCLCNTSNISICAPYKLTVILRL